MRDATQSPQVARYLRLRNELRTVLSALSHRVDKRHLRAAAELLGMLDERQRLAGITLHELNVLTDFALFNLRLGKKTLAQSFFESTRAKFGSETEQVFDALRAARYSIFRIEGFPRLHAVGLRDVFHGDSIELMDVCLASSASARWHLATRVIPFPGFWMALGAHLVVPGYAVNKLLADPPGGANHGSPEAYVAMNEAQVDSFVCDIINTALNEGGSAHADSIRAETTLLGFD